MKLKRSTLRDAIALALAVGTAGIALPALAADQTPQEQQASSTSQDKDKDKAKTLDTLVVTGTRIQSQTITASSPVTEINQEQFVQTGATRVDDLVNQMPQMAPYFDSFANNGATGYPTADLRGLGTNRTLVLINGQRVQSGTAFAVDLSQIPSGLVKRVDLLTGGASAVYGADAVAGVVNFILDDEFEGFQVNLGTSAYQHDNSNGYIRSKLTARGFPFPDGNTGMVGKSQNVDLIWGSQFADGAGHASAWLSWRKNDPLFQGQFDYSSCALNDAGTACGGSSTAAKPNFLVFAHDGSYGDFAHLGSSGNWLPGVGERYNYAPPNYYQRPESKVNFGTSIKLEINEHFRPFLDAMYMNRSSSVQIAESGTFFGQLLTLNCNDPLVGTMCSDLGITSTTPVDIYVGKRNVEGGPRRYDEKTSTYRVATGVEGSINDVWSYNVSAVFGRNDVTRIGTNDFLSDRVTAALLGCPTGSFTGCVPYNVWVPNGVTPQAAAALSGVSMVNITTRLADVSAYVSGDLGYSLPWAGNDPVKLVAGVEWRQEQYKLNADSNSQAGNFAGAGGPTLPLSGTTKVKELFVESSVPVIKDAGMLNSLNLDLGYRYSDYDLSGSTNTYKLGFAAQFMENYRIRGGYNRAVRAPNINELFSQQQIQLFGGADPCEGPTPALSAAQCALTGVTTAQYGNIPVSPANQYNQFTGGNPNLKPEQADTYTIGFAATPIKSLDLAVDYYDIRLKKRIGTLDPNTVLLLCAQTGDPFLCNKIHRNPVRGDLWVGSNPATSGYIDNLTTNFGNLRVRGIDLSARYGWDMFGGRANVSFIGTRELEYQVEPLPGVNPSATFDCTGRINTSCRDPKWRHIANASFSRDWWSVNLRWRYYGQVDYVNTDGTQGSTDQLLVQRGNRIGAYNWFDLSGTFQLGQLFSWTVGVNNIADKEPPMVGATLAGNANAPLGYDQAGRFFFTSLTMKF